MYTYLLAWKPQQDRKGGKGTRKRVAPSTVLPKNWKDFLRVDENKTELFAFMSREAVNLPLPQDKELYATDGSGVLCSPAESHLAGLAPCSHEEADTRLLLHVADAVQKGVQKGNHTYRWYWCGCTCRGFIQQGSSWWAVDRFRCRIKLSVHSCSRNGCHHDSDTVYDSPSLSCVHRVWHCFCIRWQRKEDCLGNLEVFPRGEWCF